MQPRRNCFRHVVTRHNHARCVICSLRNGRSARSPASTRGRNEGYPARWRCRRRHDGAWHCHGMRERRSRRGSRRGRCSGAGRCAPAIHESYAGSVSKGRMSEADMRAHVERIEGTVDLERLRDSDLVVEAIFEDMEVKQRLFADLDRICSRGVILATNTSALDIDAIASATSRPGEVIGLHFFSPAHVMSLVEVVRGRESSLDVIATSMALAKRLRKLGVLAGNCDGFIGNRMLVGYRREAEFLLLEGATPEQVDGALLRFGMPMGPHAMGDMAGLDISAAGRKRRRLEGKFPTMRASAPSPTASSRRAASVRRAVRGSIATSRVGGRRFRPRKCMHSSKGSCAAAHSAPADSGRRDRRSMHTALDQRGRAYRRGGHRTASRRRRRRVGQRLWISALSGWPDVSCRRDRPERCAGPNEAARQ